VYICSSGRRVIENKHSTEIGARLTSTLNAHTAAWRRRFNVGRVLNLYTPPLGQTRGRLGMRLNVGRVLVLNTPLALRNHCIAFFLLRVTPRLRAWQVMLATSFERNDAEELEEEEDGRKHRYTTSKHIPSASRNEGPMWSRT
jgi:hypothetical protein